MNHNGGGKLHSFKKDTNFCVSNSQYTDSEGDGVTWQATVVNGAYRQSSDVFIPPQSAK